MPSLRLYYFIREWKGWFDTNFDFRIFYLIELNRYRIYNTPAYFSAFTKLCSFSIIIIHWSVWRPQQVISLLHRVHRPPVALDQSITNLRLLPGNSSISFVDVLSCADQLMTAISDEGLPIATSMENRKCPKPCHCLCFLLF